jgi:deoxyribodipyrimidine photolyase
MYGKGLMIFRRDFRIKDNRAFNYVIKNCKDVICTFIFNPKQIDNQNKYKSDNCI